MKIDSINVVFGIRAAIYQDVNAANPWEEWDGNPPLLAYSDRSLTPYGEEVTALELLGMIPVSKLRPRAAQDEILAACGIDPEDYARERKNETGTPGDRIKNAIAELIASGYASNLDKPGYYGSYDEYFDALETLAKYAGVPTYRGTARGSCQGDWAEILVFGTPEWVKETGINPDKVPAALEGAFDLWEAWAFGNVYGYVLETEEVDEDGNFEEGQRLDEIDPAGHYSCWSFYGDPEDSGLIEDAKSNAAAFLEWQEKERAAALDAACRDIVTV